MESIRPVPTGVPSEEGAPAPAELGELLKLSARGDEQAFATLYDATSSRAYGLAVRVVRDPAQAEEVTQEAFLEIWKTAARFDTARGSGVSWMLTIVHRKAVDRVRSAEASSRRDVDVPPTEPTDRARRDSRGRSGLTRSPPGPRRALRPHSGAARGARAGVLRGLHTHGGGDHAGPTGRHRQDPNTRRTDPSPRRDGSGSMSTEIHALSGAYAIDALDDIERAQFERHLADCAECRAEVDSLREAAALLPETTSAVPSAALRERVLAGIATVRPLPPLTVEPPVRRRPRFRPAALGGGCCCSDRGGRRRPSSGSPGTTSPRSPGAERSRPGAPGRRRRAVRPGPSRTARKATLTRSKSLNQAVLVTEDMAPPPEGKVYELWLDHEEVGHGARRPDADRAPTSPCSSRVTRPPPSGPGSPSSPARRLDGADRRDRRPDPLRADV